MKLDEKRKIQRVGWYRWDAYSWGQAKALTALVVTKDEGYRQGTMTNCLNHEFVSG